MKAVPFSEACANCRTRPCLSLVHGSERVTLARSREIPWNCPLAVKRQAELQALRGQVDALPRRSWFQAARPPKGSHFDTLLPLLSGGELSLLHIPFGGEAHRALNRWNASRATARKRQQEAQAAEAEALAQEEVPALENPAWIGADGTEKAGETDTEATDAFGDEYVYCRVDTRHFAPGDSLLFKIQDAADDAKLETLSGSMGYSRKEDAAMVKWKVPPRLTARTEMGKPREVYFIARATSKGLEVKSGKLALHRNFEFSV